MLDVFHEKKIISLHAVMHSRDIQQRTAGICTEDSSFPSPVSARVHNVNYIGLSKSIEAEGTRKVLYKLGDEIRKAITESVADERRRTKKLYWYTLTLKKYPCAWTLVTFQKTAKRKPIEFVQKWLVRILYQKSTKMLVNV